MGERIRPPVTGVEVASPPTAPPSPYQQRAEADGLDIFHEERVSKTSEITLESNTVYAVEGDLENDALVQGTVDNVAIVSLDADRPRLAVRGDDRRRFEIDVDGDGFLWSGIDIDQSAPNAWGRFRAAGDRMTVERVEYHGRGRQADPTPNEPLGYKAGPTFSMPATTPNSTNRIRNVDLVFGGVLDVIHFGDRPIGVFLGANHEGTLEVEDVRIEEIPNNAIYAAACPGRVEVSGYRAWNNGVTQGRISHGYFEDFDVGYDYEASGLNGAYAPRHGLVGLAVEQKKAAEGGTGTPPAIRNGTIRMENVGKCGGGIRGYDIHSTAEIGDIENVDIHIEDGAGDYTPDIQIPGGVGAIQNCELSGSNAEYHSIDTDSDETVTVRDTTWDYPSGRQQDNGGVDWQAT